METLLIDEVRAYVAYAKLRYLLYYWRTHDGVEVNLLCETGDGFVAVEMKAAKRWDRRYNRGLNRIRETSAPTGSPVTASHEGERPALWGPGAAGAGVLQLLWNGKVVRRPDHAGRTDKKAPEPEGPGA